MSTKPRKINIPGDKSITHRSIILGSIARGKTLICHPLLCDDTLSTINAFRTLGVKIIKRSDRLEIYGRGLNGLTVPDTIIDCGNSATTMRLLMGLLAGQNFDSYLTGDESLMNRPMDRVIIPLTQMGTSIVREDNVYHISGRKLKSVVYDMPVSSAQVKSAIMLADLYAEGTSVINDTGTSRNHTELMLDYFGKPLRGRKITIPGDVSSAAYHIARTLLIPGAEITIKNVGVNLTRTGYIDVLRSMGAEIRIRKIRRYGYEPVADISARYSHLHATEICGAMIPRVIDELPLLAVLSAFAEGKTVIRDAGELRFKESDRIRSVVLGLKTLGVNAIELPDGLEVTGMSSDNMRAGVIDSYNDHRIAMSFLILSGIIPGIKVENKECVAVSYPTFFEDYYI